MTIFLTVDLNNYEKIITKDALIITMTAINEIVDLSMIALRHMGLPLLEKLPIKDGEFASKELRLYLFRVPISTFCLILCLCHAILMEKHK